MANNNGGIIGKNNGTSFAGAVEIQTTLTASGPGTLTTQSGTGLINALVVAGGAGGGGSVGCGGSNGGGGAGGRGAGMFAADAHTSAAFLGGVGAFRGFRGGPHRPVVAG